MRHRPADRERYYGIRIRRRPASAFALDEYAERRRLIDAGRASVEHRPGEVYAGVTADRWPVVSGDTTHVDAVDRWGNLFAATPSGGWIGSSPVVEGLGFPLGTRGQMFYLDEKHANALVPGKRPRTTLSPSLALKNGQPWLAFGTPGGDQQDQWSLQFFLNVVDFGMDFAEALDAAECQTTHFPGSFYPHGVGSGVPRRVAHRARCARRSRRAATMSIDGPWSRPITAVAFDPDSGVVSGAASPRGASLRDGPLS
jgi:gamma-glutamyltranspeptidase/glutathione hydrolase